MSRRGGFFGKSGPESPERSDAQREHDAAQEAAGGAWRYLARAGAPRCPRGERETCIKRAALDFDQARAHLAAARFSYGRLKGKVDRAEEARRAGPQKVPDGDGGHYIHEPRGAKAHEKAGLTSLRALVGELPRQMIWLGECLRAYRGGEIQRPFGSSKEAEIASRYATVFFGDVTPRACNWCGEMDRKYSEHYALDGEGYPVKREDGRRFCCHSCFMAGKDLAEPAPKPLDVQPDPERVAVSVDGPPALPPAPKLLTAGDAA